MPSQSDSRPSNQTGVSRIPGEFLFFFFAGGFFTTEPPGKPLQAEQHPPNGSFLNTPLWLSNCAPSSGPDTPQEVLPKTKSNEKLDRR